MKSLYDHQRLAVESMDVFGSIGILYAPGTGKTAVALTWIRDALMRGEIEDALVICPASVVPSWERNIERMIEFEGWTDIDVEMVRDAVTISSYQMLYKGSTKETHHRDGEVSRRRLISLRENIDKRWGAIFVDESQALGGHSSVQTRVCLRLAQMTSHRFILTGTPFSGGGGKEDFQKLFGQIGFLAPGEHWRNWTDFCSRYVTKYDKWFKPIEYDREACLNLLYEHCLVARIEDCVDMPERTEIDMPGTIGDRKMYRDVKKGLLTDYDPTAQVIGNPFIKLLQICSGHMKRSDGSVVTTRNWKADALREILDSTDDKVVVFCQYRQSIDDAAAACIERGRRTIVFDGRTADKHIWERFQDDPSYTAIVLQYKAGGPGLDLFASHTMVMYEPTLSAENLTQSMARIYRVGQTNRCIYHFLITEKTIEEHTWRKVRSGKDVSENDLAEWAASEKV